MFLISPKNQKYVLNNLCLLVCERVFSFSRSLALQVGAYSYEPNAFKFGDRPQSHSIISIGKHLWQTNFDIQFDFRTFYPNGLLFFIPVNMLLLSFDTRKFPC